jgi:hypothetical protein
MSDMLSSNTLSFKTSIIRSNTEGTDDLNNRAVMRHNICGWGQP